MNDKPFVKYYDDAIYLYSGKDEDAVPFLGIRLSKGKVIFQVPGGNSLILSLQVTVNFCLSLARMINDSIEPGLKRSRDE